MRNPLILLVLLLTLSFSTLAQTTENTITATVVSRGHAHNDYEHPRPLMQALELGYRSIEVDIWLHDGKLVVSHDSVNLDKKPTLQALYLDSLKAIYKVAFRYKLKESEPLVLMIDVKSKGEKVFEVLQQVLAQYNPILTKHLYEKTEKNLVSILISGNIWGAIEARRAHERWMTFDLPLKEALRDVLGDMITRVSGNYKEYFKWDGTGQMPADEYKKLLEYVAQTHEYDRQIRFWGAPDTPELWNTFLDAGVDWINTDKLVEFQQFYIQYQNTKR